MSSDTRAAKSADRDAQRRAERKAAPLIIGLSCSLCAMSAAMLGPFVMGWGLALGVAAASLVLGIGLLYEDDVALSHATRFAVAGALGFGLVTIAMTWPRGGELSEETLTILNVGSLDDGKRALIQRWLTFFAGTPVALFSLFKKRKNQS